MQTVEEFLQRAHAEMPDARRVLCRWLVGEDGVVGNLSSLKLTANAPENRPGPNRKGLYSNHPFSGANMLVSGRVLLLMVQKSG